MLKCDVCEGQIMVDPSGEFGDCNSCGYRHEKARITEKEKNVQHETKNAIAKFEIGTIHKGTVIKTMDFGAWVEFGDGKEGLVHISELANRRIEKVEEVCVVGDEILVKIIKNNFGKYQLSHKKTIID